MDGVLGQRLGGQPRPEIVDVRTRWLARKGKSGVPALREFHDALTGSGAMPTSLAERALAI